MTFSFAVFGAASARARLLAVPGKVQGAAVVGMGRGMQLAQSIVRSKASGRPGPRVRTGDFRRSIVGEAEAVPTGARGRVGSSAPQAARLEFGFYGRDALGRNYNQPPFPYLLPSVPEVERAVTEQISQAVADVTRQL